MSPGIYDRMEQKRRRRCVFWWLILLPLLGGTYFWFGEEQSSIEPIPTSSPNQVSKVEVAYSDVLPKYRSKQGKIIDKNLNYWNPQSSIFKSNFALPEKSLELQKTSSHAFRQKGIGLDLLQGQKLNVLSYNSLLHSSEVSVGKPEKATYFESIVSVSAFGGMGFFEQGFSDNVNTSYLSLFPDFNFGLEAQWEWKQYHAFSASWSYQQWTEEFFFEDRNEFVTEIDNQLIYRRESTITGNVIDEQYGTVQANATRYRKERAYNEYQAHLIAVSYERIWSLSMKHSLSAGISVQAMLGLNGVARRLNANGEIQDFNQRGGYSFGGGLIGLQLRYAYQLRPDWAVWIKLQGLQSFTNWDTAAESYTFPRVLNTQLGVRYRINRPK